MKEKIKIAITAASYSGNKGAAAMLQSSVSQLKEAYGDRLQIHLMSVYPSEDRLQCPHDFVDIIPAQPQRVLLLAFPCAVLYRICSWCPPCKKILSKNEMLKAYQDTDLVIDEAGIAFSDSRGFLLNTYAFACAAIPMLMGVPVVKYSQALGPFHDAYNRFLASWILPKMKLVIARGRLTYAHLKAIGIRSQVRQYADGAFTMPPDPAAEKRVQDAWKEYRPFHTAALSISSVVERKCKKAGIDYCRVMAEFIAYLTGQGYQVYMFANAARIHSDRPRNNDLMTGDAIMQEYRKLVLAQNSRKTGRSGNACKDVWKTGKDGSVRNSVWKTGKDGSSRGSRKNVWCRHAQQDRDGTQKICWNGLIWEHREMAAEEIRACIAQCDCLIACRFHAMVFALSRQIPVMLIGWSHKYQEVMEQFGLGEYAADYSRLSLEELQQSFAMFLENQEEIRRKIREHLPAVQHSSGKNIRHIVKLLDEMLAEKSKNEEKGKKEEKSKESSSKHVKCCKKKRYLNHVIDLEDPDRYIGSHLLCRMGYAADPQIRKNAASGGMVTALLCSLLKNHAIDGAWVVKTAFTENKEITYETFVATSARQICDASSSVYMKIPMLSHLNQLRDFDGRLAVVLTPCMMRAFAGILEKDEELRKKIVLKIGLFCSGAHDRKATEYALDQCGIARDGAKRLYYRRGHWRGVSSVLYEDGSQKEFSYTKSVCAYKNAYFFIEPGCLHCRDQFAECADISFGDVWLSEVKKDAVKYTGCVVRSRKAYEMLVRAQRQGDIRLHPMTDEQMLRSQMRALTFKYRGRRWNHRLAGWLAVKNRDFSAEHPVLLRKVPLAAVYYYMCMIRVLLSW